MLYVVSGLIPGYFQDACPLRLVVNVMKRDAEIKETSRFADQMMTENNTEIDGEEILCSFVVVLKNK